MLGFVLIAALAASAALTAQQPTVTATPEQAKQMEAPTTPQLTDAQRAQIVIAAQQQEIWNLKLSQAQNELQKASAALQQLIASVTPPGYVLGADLTFQKVEATKKEPGTQ